MMQARPTASATNTASPDEIERFSRLASTWWDVHGEFGQLHKLNPVRIGFIRDHVLAHFGRDGATATPFAGLGMVDLGCGGGLLTEPMARLGARVTGIDAEANAIAVAEAHARQSNLDITYRCVLPEVLAAEGEAFDVVLSMEVIEHVADVDGFLAASARLMKPGGAMVVATLNRTLKSLALAKIGAEYILRWVPPGTHDWRKFLPPKDLARALRRQGLGIVDRRGISYSPILDRWSLSDDLSINYLTFVLGEAGGSHGRI